MIIILHPFIDAASHITEALASVSGGEFANRAGEWKTAMSSRSVAIGRLFSPWVGHLLSTVSRGKFPLRFRRQSGADPGRKGLCIFPAHTIDRVVVCICVEESPAGRLGADARVHTLPVLRHGDGVPHNVEGGHGYNVRWRCSAIA